MMWGQRGLGIVRETFAFWFGGIELGRNIRETEG